MRILDMIRKWFRSSSSGKRMTYGERVAWTVRGGRVYHLYPMCPSCRKSGKTPTQTTVSKARLMGLRECGMCQAMLDRARKP